MAFTPLDRSGRGDTSLPPISALHNWRDEWAVEYSSDARAVRKMFFDHFLKGTDNRILEVREFAWKYRTPLTGPSLL